MIGKIEKIPLRDVWKHEAYDFTTWLMDNLDVLNEELNITLVSAENEQSAGSFSVDLVAEDTSGNPVIIENQLEKSNHDHLGKVITYLTAIGAKTAIWIVSEPRPEHINAVNWLNESSDAGFYFFKVEAIKIGDSDPAPLLTLITGPSLEAKEAGAKKKEIAERYSLRYTFWKLLLEKALAKTKLHANISPSEYSWVGTSKNSLWFNYSVTKNTSQAELYIDKGKDSEEENQKIFHNLLSHKSEIENIFGGELNWEELKEKRACRISYRIEIGGYRDEEKYDEIHDALIDTMIKLEKSLKSFLPK